MPCRLCCIVSLFCSLRIHIFTHNALSVVTARDPGWALNGARQCPSVTYVTRHSDLCDPTPDAGFLSGRNTPAAHRATKLCTRRRCVFARRGPVSCRISALFVAYVLTDAAGPSWDSHERLEDKRPSSWFILATITLPHTTIITANR